MALQVWLPLINNTNNQGIDNVNIINNGATNVTGGKLGNCYQTGSSKYIKGELNYSWFKTTFSILGWFKLNNITTTKEIFILGPGYGWNNIHFGLVTVRGTAYSNIANGSTSARPITFSVAANTWYHYAFTYNAGQISVYLNGRLINSSNISITPSFSTDTMLGVGAAPINGGEPSDGYVNDFRVYDECLSPAQIKEISKGLVIHYTFDKLENNRNTNLIINSLGDFGNEGWRAGTFYDDVPSGSNAVKSVKDAISNRFLIDVNHTYSVSAYLKCTQTTSTYPSIYFYDVDNLLIYHYMTHQFFLSNTLTTLTEPLKPGDTVLHCADLTNWTTSTASHAYRVAIFGYRDSTGHLYEDLTYTRDCPAFGSYDDKSHIDKTNNTITLNSAYIGEFRPSGTHIAQATHGANWLYPWGGINSTNTGDWTYKSAYSFTPYNTTYGRYAKYMEYHQSGSNTYVAQLRILDVTSNNSYYLTSNQAGYDLYKSYNSYETETSSSSPKYTQSYVFRYIKQSDIFGMLSSEYSKQIYIGLDGYTVSFWINLGAESTYLPDRFNYIFANSGIENYGGVGCAWDHDNNKFVWLCQNTALNQEIKTKNSFTDSEIYNKWVHVAIVRNPSDPKIGYFYINGVRQDLETIPQLLDITSSTTKGMFNLQFGWNLYARMSDFRYYVTALSENEILDLYKLGARIDNKLKFHSLEISEPKYNQMFSPNIGIHNKTFTDGLSSYTQSNCQVTLTDSGLRIYRPPNINPTDQGNTMWGGLRLENAGNRFSLRKNHTYVWGFTVSGKSSNVPSFQLTNQMDWEGGGLNPAPSDRLIKNIPTNFQGENFEVWDKFTIIDDVWKQCTSSYSSFVEGNWYLSYRHFGWGFGYQNTGTLGTDLYLDNIRMYDITDIPLKNINEIGVSNFLEYIEDRGVASINLNKSLYTNEIVEI